ncbi:hypothetical protein BDM02DRAFT_503066 [Thelephora ganbajun]|uniref:Uncharacterized protein n=1 Tax=Thelephora ganbajun TaxID=370292 RepID=A0ACB6Z795_THEGA|nr:hypothetical protein BDM02DRAFT_503066 [Thelephora ganbajun]
MLPTTKPHLSQNTSHSATLPAESQPWNELPSMPSLDAPLPDLSLRSFSPVSIPPTSTFVGQAIPNDTVPLHPSLLPLTSKLPRVRPSLTHRSPERPRKMPEDCCSSTVAHRQGCHVYRYRVDYLPIRQRWKPGSVYNMVFPRGQPQGPIGVHAVRVFDGPFSSYASFLLLDRYTFAVLGCYRQIMRSGAMWFIEDPQHQNMHPIRDILERHTFTHLYKPFQTTIMYALVVVCGVGHVSLIVQVFTPSLLLLRWKLSCSAGRYCPMGVDFKEAAHLVVYVWRVTSKGDGFPLTTMPRLLGACEPRSRSLKMVNPSTKPRIDCFRMPRLNDTGVTSTKTPPSCISPRTSSIASSYSSWRSGLCAVYPSQQCLPGQSCWAEDSSCYSLPKRFTTGTRPLLGSISCGVVGCHPGHRSPRSSLATKGE